MWEGGGGMSNTGGATIVASNNGEPLTPIYVRGKGQLSCAGHALFVVEQGTLVVRASHHREDFTIRVGTLGRIFRFGDCELRETPQPWPDCDPESPKAILRPCPVCGDWTDGNGVHQKIRSESEAVALISGCMAMATFSEGEWDEEPLPEWLPAIEAAKAKATCYHCREPHYAR